MPRQAVLVPPVRPGPGVVVREVPPGRAVLAVVLAHGAPGPLGQVWTPAPPGRAPRRRPRRAGPARRRWSPCGHGRQSSPCTASTRRSTCKDMRSWWHPAGGRPVYRMPSVPLVCGEPGRGRPGNGWSPTASGDTPWAPSAACAPVATTGCRWWPAPRRRAPDLGLASPGPRGHAAVRARVRLAAHEWASGAVDPRGHELLESFDLADGLPRWRWRVGDVVMERVFAMRHGRPAWRSCTGWWPAAR